MGSGDGGHSHGTLWLRLAGEGGVHWPLLPCLSFPVHTSGGPRPFSALTFKAFEPHRAHWSSKELSQGNPGSSLAELGGWEGAGRRGWEAGSAGPSASLPPFFPPSSLLSRRLGVRASNKSISQTWAREPEAAWRSRVGELLAGEVAGHRVSQGVPFF